MENPVLPSSCVTPAGTSIEVQNEWEENTTHTLLSLWHVVVVVVVVSHIQRIGCQPKKTTLRGGQSRSWSAERGKKRRKKVWQRLHPPSLPPPPSLRAARSEKKKKKKKTRDASSCLGATQVGVMQVVSVRLASVQGFLRLVSWANGCRFAKFYASVCNCSFPSLVASLFSWRCLAASSSSSLHAASNLRPP